MNFLDCDDYGKMDEMLSLTIEGQLERYTKLGELTERYSDLLNAWRHNKKWLSELLEWILPSFPTYSRHDVSHAKMVLHNIEMLLGKDAIRQLSATECFVLLHTVYVHDIGMCITHDYRQILLSDKKEEFYSFLKEVEKSDNMKEFAEILLADTPTAIKCINGDLDYRLKIYYGIIFLMGEFRRKRHGQESGKLLKRWIDQPDKLGSGFSTSGIPSRFFYTISQCAALHTSYNFQDIMDLPMMDGGYAHDYFHPRFIAVLLQLGDALDLDNNRFHPLMQDVMGIIPRSSQIHLGKHRSIRHLSISPEQIRIDGDCRNVDEMRQLQMEGECINTILKDASYNWSLICPREVHAVLPTLKKMEIQLNDEKLDEKLVNLKFEIQQKKAFNLLKGSKIYHEEKHVFLREVIQNAFDATKLQYWKDWGGLVQPIQMREGGKFYDMSRFWETLPVSLYPIDIEFHLAAVNEDSMTKDSFAQKYICIESMYDYEKWNKNHENRESKCGILIRVKDHGVGITEEDVKKIADVGSSHFKGEDGMPEWLQPTAEFGVGLQSIFLVADDFQAITHTRQGKDYRIEFETTGNNGRGYINVIPLKNESGTEYGTTFEIFVRPDRDKYINSNVLQDEDIFDRDLDDSFSIARNYREDLFAYLNGIIGEKIFPINVHVYEIQDLPKWQGSEYNKFSNCNRFFYVNGKPKAKLLSPYSAYLTDQQELHCVRDEFGSESLYFWYEEHTSKLHIRSKDMNQYIGFSSERLIHLIDDYQNGKNVEELSSAIPIFYKGIKVMEIDCDKDFGMIEFIDIKGKLIDDGLALNRVEFTEIGKNYIKNDLLNKVLNMIDEVLQSEEFAEIVESISNGLFVKWQGKESLDSKYKNIEKTLKENSDWYRLLLGLIGMYSFRQVKSGVRYVPSPINNSKSVNLKMKWNTMIQNMSSYIDVFRNKYTAKEIKDAWCNAMFFNLTVYDPAGIAIGSENMAKIINSNNRYAIISHRETLDSPWKEKLIFLGERDDEGKERPERVAQENNNLKVIDEINQLKTQREHKARSELIKSITKWSQDAFTLSKNFFKQGDLVTEENSKDQTKEHLVLKWMLLNYPTIALFSGDGDLTRINILALTYTDSVYMNNETKYAIYNRIIEKSVDKNKDKVMNLRYAVVSSTAFCQLSVKKLPAGLKVMTRGLTGGIGNRNMILPLTAKTICDLKIRFESQYSDIIKIFSAVSIESEQLKELKESSVLQEKIGNGAENIYNIAFKDKMNEYVKQHPASTNANETENAKTLESNSDMVNTIIQRAADIWKVLFALKIDDQDEMARVMEVFGLFWEKFKGIKEEFTSEKIFDTGMKECFDVLKEYYALPEANTEACKQAKENLIRYAYDNRLMQDLKQEDIIATYDAYVEDMALTLLKPVVDQLEPLYRNFFG